MTVISIQDRLDQVERLNVPAQTKLTQSESDRLDDLVQFFKDRGVKHATRSGLIRALINQGLEAHREVTDEIPEMTARRV